MFDRVPTMLIGIAYTGKTLQCFTVSTTYNQYIFMQKHLDTKTYFVSGVWSSKSVGSPTKTVGSILHKGDARSRMTDIKTARKQFAIFVATAILDTKNG